MRLNQRDRTVFDNKKVILLDGIFAFRFLQYFGWFPEVFICDCIEHKEEDDMIPYGLKSAPWFSVS